MPTKPPLPRAACVYTDKWGMMRGYFKGKAVIQFGPPTYDNQHRATEWLYDLVFVQKVAYPQTSSEIKLHDVRAWAARNEKPFSV